MTTWTWIALAVVLVTFFGWAIAEAWLESRHGPPPPDPLEDPWADCDFSAWAADMERLYEAPAHIPDHEKEQPNA